MYCIYPNWEADLIATESSRSTVQAISIAFMLLAIVHVFLISLKFVWRWCCEASLSVYFHQIFGQVIKGMPFVDGSEMRRPQKGSIKTGPKISDTLSLNWCKRDFSSLLFSGRRAKKDTKNRMKKVGMCAPGTEY